MNILFEDTHLLVLNKPAGLLSQGDESGDENLVDLLRAHFGRNYVGLVHRLDRNTSGLMVVAKRSKAADRLTQALRDGKLKRAYLCCVNGLLREKTSWTDFLLKDEKNNTVKCVPQGTRGAKEATLHITPLWQHKAHTLCRIDLDTGRSHQIRVQCAKHGHALLGDSKYASPDVAQKAWRPALHSAFLSFPHPMSKELMNFESPWPEDLKHLVQ
jgi:23S rRNA pseudouridine1911/1915/1917 synthase